MSTRQTIPLKSSSPRPTAGGAKSNTPLPRIPLELCDGPTQRLYAFSAFVLLQALKLWYWMGIARADYAAEFFGFILWLSLDVLFLVLINYLRIPWLELPFLRLVLAFFTLTIINFVLFTAREISPTAIAASSAYKVWGYIRSPVSSWAEEPNADDHEHLLGKYTLLLKPYSSAEFNREGRCYCIPRNSGFLMDKPEIPLIFNGSEPYSLSYSFTSFATNATTVRSLTGPFGEGSKEFRKTRSNLDNGSTVFALQAKEPGAYRIVQALDAEKGAIRVTRNEAYVVTCPEAHLPGHAETTDVCTNKGDADIPITVWGLPPWRVTYQRRSLGAKQETQELVIESEPPGYESPFLPGWFEGDTPNYGWAKPRELDLTANLGLGTPGEYHFAISEIRDGCGNKVNYQALRAQDKIEAEVKKVNVRSRPTVSATCDPRKPIKIVELHESSANIGLNVRHGQAPYTIRYTHQKDDLDKPVFLKDLVLKNLDDPHITVRKSGLYNIISIADKYCNGTVELPSDCEVAVASKPTVEISATAIEDQCAGAIGLTMVATFTGEGPWTLCYDIYRNNNYQQNMCKNSPKPRLSLELKPELAGLYRYDFKTVSDRNYGHIAVSVDPVLQMIHPQPHAEFVPVSGNNRACRGSQKEIKIQAYGEGPWDLQYQILHGGQAKVVTLENIQESLVNVTLPLFEHEGMYSVDLVSITDRANGCTKSLNVKDMVIEVAPNPPTAAFECPGVIEIPEGGEKDLRIHLTGGTPWFIRFGLKGDNTTYLHRADMRNALVKVNKPGEYQLRSVEDAFCQGVVVPPADVCKVVYSQKPSMQLAIDSIQFKGGPAHEKIVRSKDDLFVMPPVCQDSVRTLEVVLNGKAPFELKYELAYKPIKGSVERVARTGRTEHSTLRLQVENKRPGTYSYRLLKLSDSLYPDVDIRHKDKAVVFEHVIRPLPTASILKHKKQTFCKDEPRDDQEKIAIKIEDGAGPYELTIEVEGPGRSKDVIEVPNVVPVKGIYHWTPPTQFTQIGTYKVSVVRVADMNGCQQSSQQALEQASIEFEIVDTPRINIVNAEKCVGGKVKYTLEGLKPFQIQYSLDSSARTETVNANNFEYRSTKAGNLTIHQVCHQVGSQQTTCCSRPIDMTTRIWDLPAAKIADGHSVVRNMRDGERAEIVVTLEGEPPFSFEYVRKTPEYDSAKRWLGYKEVKERVRVDDVHEKHHFIHAATEGTFELLYIKDNHCEYRKRSRV
ncbi:hypothetical protein DFQ27_006850 [Actinomortierella ambigua]|uniref:Nucleoporin Pom152 n=1 Tax=Actinomortierella ambigua TaxID=1343610 RepID=A0A9P6TZX1_9FUNG|nr:hypothetical protein DFQ27_006850 [Actinomortierella ambigua]